MKTLPALTLIELLVVIGIIAVVAIPSVIVFNNVRINQSLVTSAESLATVIERAHLFARDGKDEKAWGVRKDGNNNYILISGNPVIWSMESEYRLEPGIKFNGPASVWFVLGSGEITGNFSIKLETLSGNKVMKVEVNQAGVVTVKKG